MKAAVMEAKQGYLMSASTDETFPVLLAMQHLLQNSREAILARLNEACRVAGPSVVCLQVDNDWEVGLNLFPALLLCSGFRHLRERVIVPQNSGMVIYRSQIAGVAMLGTQTVLWNPAVPDGNEFWRAVLLGGPTSETVN
jgi:hypothetical protein